MKVVHSYRKQKWKDRGALGRRGGVGEPSGGLSLGCSCTFTQCTLAAAPLNSLGLASLV